MNKRSCIKIAKYFVATLVISIVLIEAIGRWGFGLCDVPLYVADPTMEYRVAPDQDCHLLGKHVKINHYSMRSDDIDPKRTSSKELRILVLGDSIVYGGNRVDQTELATSIIQAELRKKLNRDDVIVCNISAGSWGPGNQLAYLQKFGDFDHDLAVIVTSSDDIVDVPTFDPIVGISPDHPNKRPLSAVWQICTRFGPRFFALATVSTVTASDPIPEHSDPRVLSAISDMVQLLHKDNKPVIYAIHRTTWNLEAKPLQGVSEMMETAAKNGATVIDMQPVLKAAVDAGQSPYRDAIHPNPVGQRVIADEILKAILPLLADKAPATQP